MHLCSPLHLFGKINPLFITGLLLQIIKPKLIFSICQLPVVFLSWCQKLRNLQRLAGTSGVPGPAALFRGSARAGHSGSCPVRSSVSPRMDTLAPLWQPAPVFDHACCKKGVFLSLNAISCMSVCVCCVLHSAQALPSRVWFCLLYWAPITYLYTLTRSLFNLLSSRLTKTSSPFLTGELLQSLHHSVGSSLDSLQYVHISLALRSPTQDTALQVSPVWS